MTAVEEGEAERKVRVLEVKAMTHVVFCSTCAGVMVRYRDRIHRPWATVPPDVATAVRAGVCKDGRVILDALLLLGGS
jgi:hypothetical protein